MHEILRVLTEFIWVRTSPVVNFVNMVMNLLFPNKQEILLPQLPHTDSTL
jgi:hypothetical protein